MNRNKLVAGAAMIFLALGGGGIAYATGSDSGEQVAGPDAEKARSAALAAVDSGTVTEVEREAGNGIFEVEVERDDGSQVELQLDRDLNVVGQETDDDRPNDEDGPDDD